MARSMSSLPLALALLLGACTITIVPAPVRPVDPNAVTGAVPEDTTTALTGRIAERRDKPAPEPARIVVISPAKWAGSNPEDLVLDPDQSVRVAGRVDYQGRVESIRVNGERVAVGGGADGVTTFVAVVPAPESGSREVRVEAVAGGVTTTAVYTLRVATPAISLPQRPGRIGRPQPGQPDPVGTTGPPADTALTAPPPPIHPGRRPDDRKPGNPGSPGNPGNAGNPGHAGNPGNPGNSGNPANPGNPGNPGSPGNSGNAGNPGNPPVVSAADSAWALRDRWAVVVGVGTYASGMVPTRQFATEDARAVEAFLRSDLAGPGGLGSDRIRVLVDEAATRDNVRAALTTFLSQAGPEDVVMVFLAGTAVADPSRPNGAYLLPHDANPASPEATAISADWLTTTLAALPVHQKILAADVLYAARRRGNAPPQNLMHRALVRTAGPRHGGIVAVMAADGDSSEGAQWGGGLFTHHLLDGLGGDGDADGDGVVTLAEMIRHARQRVEAESGGRQKPAISAAAYDRDWPMATVGAGR